MRVVLLALFLALALALPGCAGPDLQWAGVAHAYQSREGSIVEVQLHAARGAQPASEGTARAGMGAVLRIESAFANFTMRDGTTREETLVGWQTDAANHTMHVPVDLTGFDAFHMNATFVLRNGTRVRTHEGVPWVETFSRPWRADLKVVEQDRTSSVLLDLYEVHAGAREFLYAEGSSNNTMDRARIVDVPSWRLHVTLANGTSLDETATPHNLGSTLSVTLPYQGIAKLDADYTLRLQDGTLLTGRDVEGDAYPPERAYDQAQRQEN